MKKISTALLLMICLPSFAQQDSAKAPVATNPLSFSGYVEAYYSYDFNKPADNNKPSFFYSHNRHNEFNINLAFLQAAYTTDRIRANLALATGTYMNANYVAEPGVLKNIFEVDAGYKVSAKKNLWLDAGIIPSHIGFESALSKDCWDITRTIVADNSPYFESGAKLTYTTDNTKWLVSGLLLNGWQRITRVTGNSLMSFGTQVQYTPSTKLLFNYSTFIGTDKPDSARKMRYYHNLYAIISFGKIGVLPSIDVGTEQKEKGSSNMNVWYAPVMRLRYIISNKWRIAVRGEYYDDPNGVIIPTATPNGFKTTSYTCNIDYAPTPSSLIRIEARTLKSKDEIFLKNNIQKGNDFFLTGSIAVNL